MMVTCLTHGDGIGGRGRWGVGHRRGGGVSGANLLGKGRAGTFRIQEMAHRSFGFC